MKNELVEKQEVFKMVSVDSIKTLAQADEILEACNSSDGEVLEVYVQNAITRGAVYYKLTQVEKPNGNGAYMTQEDIAERYDISQSAINNYLAVYNDSDILLRIDEGKYYSDNNSLKPTLRSLLDAIKRDPEKVTERIHKHINSRNTVNGDTVDTVTKYMETASEDIRYLFSIKHQVTLGKLSSAIKDNDEAKIIKLIGLNGSSEKNTDIDITRRECADALKKVKKVKKAQEIEISELEDQITALKNRNKFLIEMINANEIRLLLRQLYSESSNIKKYGKEFMRACDVLGVDNDVTVDELKIAYRERVNIHHPDKGGNDEEFRKIVEANNTIKKYIKGLLNG